MSNGGLHTAQYWKELANEARASAEKMADGFSKQKLLDIAQKYDLMAKLSAQKEAQGPNPN